MEGCVYFLSSKRWSLDQVVICQVVVPSVLASMLENWPKLWKTGSTDFVKWAKEIHFLDDLANFQPKLIYLVQELLQFCEFSRICLSWKPLEGTYTGGACIFFHVQWCNIVAWNHWWPYFTLKFFNCCPQQFCNVRKLNICF